MFFFMSSMRYFIEIKIFSSVLSIFIIWNQWSPLPYCSNISSKTQPSSRKLEINSLPKPKVYITHQELYQSQRLQNIITYLQFNTDNISDSLLFGYLFVLWFSSIFLSRFFFLFTHTAILLTWYYSTSLYLFFENFIFVLNN